MSIAVTFWIFIAVLLGMTVSGAVLLYRQIKMRPKDQRAGLWDYGVWILIAVAFVVIFNFLGR